MTSFSQTSWKVVDPIAENQYLSSEYYMIPDGSSTSPSMFSNPSMRDPLPSQATFRANELRAAFATLKRDQEDMENLFKSVSDSLWESKAIGRSSSIYQSWQEIREASVRDFRTRTFLMIVAVTNYLRTIVLR